MGTLFWPDGAGSNEMTRFTTEKTIIGGQASPPLLRSKPGPAQLHRVTGRVVCVGQNAMGLKAEVTEENGGSWEENPGKGGRHGAEGWLPLSFCRCLQRLSILIVREIRESREGGSSLAANSSFNCSDWPRVKII